MCTDERKKERKTAGDEWGRTRGTEEGEGKGRTGIGNFGIHRFYTKVVPLWAGSVDNLTKYTDNNLLSVSAAAAITNGLYC